MAEAATSAGAPSERTPVRRHLASGAAAAIAGAVLLVAVAWNTRAAGGSDSFCYLHQAEAWAHGTLRAVNPLALEAPWPDAALTFAPMGHVPSSTVPGAVAPICPPGLSMTMAAGTLVAGRTGAWMIVPMLAALTVWCAFALGRALAGAAAGMVAAALAACSPAFLYQAVQPMSDVPATAWWLLAAWMASQSSRASAVTAASAVALAILTRPQLAPLTLGVLAIAWAGCGRRLAAGHRARRVLVILGGAAAGAASLLAFHSYIYGSPFRSGYGDASALFAWSHIAPNAERYARWLMRSQTPLVLLGLAAPFVVPGRRVAWGALLFVPLTLAVYLPYVIFDDWWYLRFLLPAVVALVVLSAAVLATGLLRLQRGGVLLILVTLLAAGWMAREARAGHVFDLQSFESRFLDAGRYAAGLPPGAVVLTVSHSGNVRYYGGRETIVWDSLDPAWLERAVAWLEAADRPVFVMIEASEEPVFRSRFERHSPLGALDWPPIAQIGRFIRLYRVADRARYMAGERVATDYVPSSQERQTRRR